MLSLKKKKNPSLCLCFLLEEIHFPLLPFEQWLRLPVGSPFNTGSKHVISSQMELRSLSMCHFGPSTYTRFWSAQSDNYLCCKFLLLPTKYVIYIDLLNKSIHDQKTVLKQSIKLFLTFMLYIWGSQCLSLTMEVIRFILLHCET